MPILNDNNDSKDNKDKDKRKMKGNLYIKFNIEFPKVLS